MFNFNSILLVSCAIATASAAATCPSFSGVDNYNNDLFLGVWYQYATYQNDLTSGDCVALLYTPACDGVKTNGVVFRLVDGTNEIDQGDYRSNSEEDPAQFYVELDGQTFINTNIYTDYSGFSFFYSCSENDNGTINEFVWVLSRTPVPDAESQVKIDEFISTSSLINPDLLLYTKQNC